MKFSYIALGAVALCVTASAHAVVLNNGDTNFADNQALISGSENALVFDNVVGKNALNQVRFTGLLGADAWQEPSGNYTFYFQYSNDATSVDAVHRLTMTGFAGFTVDAFYLGGVPAGTVAPLLVDRSNDGNTVGFDFLPYPFGPGYVQPGQATFILGIRTNATQFTEGTTSIIDGGIDTVKSFAPAVPEPTSMAALALGLVGLIRKRRSSK